jgi:hypothetical protein
MIDLLMAHFWRVYGAQKGGGGWGCAINGLKAGFMAQRTPILSRLWRRFMAHMAHVTP